MSETEQPDPQPSDADTGDAPQPSDDGGQTGGDTAANDETESSSRTMVEDEKTTRTVTTEQ